VEPTPTLPAASRLNTQTKYTTVVFTVALPDEQKGARKM
jgi:hypothetical protein